MIVAEQKSLEEIRSMLDGYRKVLAVGCGTCVTVCFSGGRQEVGILSASIRMSSKIDGKAVNVEEAMVQRQCEYEFVDALGEKLDDYDAILSLGCGIGVQTIAERYPNLPVFPALNTTLMGYPSEQGVWEERCQGCGNCVLHLTGGICPVSRCAKQLFNGPCGGSKGGVCEVDPDTECAWHTITLKQLERHNLEGLMEIQPAKDWSTARDGGHRRIVRDDIRKPRPSVEGGEEEAS
jgi:ferredoxin